jgi:hypothetical protein
MARIYWSERMIMHTTFRDSTPLWVIIFLFLIVNYFLEPTGVLNAQDFGSWGVEHIGADEVHAFDTLHQLKLNKVKLCHLDSGLDYNHPQLKPSYKGGFDVIANDNDPMDEDPSFHGTKSAGIVISSSGDGVIGVAPPLPILSPFPHLERYIDYYMVRIAKTNVASFSAIESGMKWCIDNNMNIILVNAGVQYPFSLGELVQAAAAKGILIIAPSGNQNKNLVNCPSCFDQVIAVGATDKYDKRWDDGSSGGSNYGRELDLVAPGVSIKSTVGGKSHYTDKYGTGTSFSAPHVAGVAALVWAHMPNPSASVVKDRLLGTAQDLGPVGRDDEYGYGLVNAASATLAFAETSLTLEPLPDVAPGTEITLSGRLFTKYISPDPNNPRTSTRCSEPCRPVRDATITFDGPSGSIVLPSPVNTDNTGSFRASFTSPGIVGEWEIKAHYAGNSINLYSTSLIQTYRTTYEVADSSASNGLETSSSAALCQPAADNIKKLESNLSAKKAELAKLVSSGRQKEGEGGVRALSEEITQLEKDIPTEKQRLQECNTSTMQSSLNSTEAIEHKEIQPPLTTNSAPQAMNITAETTSNSPIQIRLQGQDSDDANTNLTASIVSGPFNGQLGDIDQSSGNLTYTPAADYSGQDQFTYVVNDGIVDSNIAKVSITVTPMKEGEGKEDGGGGSGGSGDSGDNDGEGGGSPLCSELSTMFDEATGECVPIGGTVTDECEEGTALNETTGECVPVVEPPVCEDGSTPDELGQCPMPAPVTNGCDEGTALDEATGECVPVGGTVTDGCEEGTALNETTGECVPVVEPPVCEDGSTPDELGQCPMPAPVTNGCEEGTALDEATGQCVPVCEEGTALDEATVQCVPAGTMCEEGTIPDETTGECVPLEPSAPVITCEDGSVPDEQSQCSPIQSECPDGTIPDELAGCSTIPMMPDCQAGTAANENGECVPLVAPKVDECPEGTSPDETTGECVPI